MEIVEWIRDRLSRELTRLPSQFRLMLLSIGVGVVAGLGAILFDRLLGWMLQNVLGSIAGYAEPRAGTPAASLFTFSPVRSLWFFIIPALGGLISGVVVYFVAPEAEGHGTDAMIEAFHLRGGGDPKTGAVHQDHRIGLDNGNRGVRRKGGPDRTDRVGVRVHHRFPPETEGAGAADPRARRRRRGGIGAIFQAPLGAALFAPEVLYREAEFEYEAILPCIGSSITSYTVYTQLYKRGALFFPGTVGLSLPRELLPYALFGIVCALTGFVYVRTFYGSRDRFFKPLRIHKMLKPVRRRRQDPDLRHHHGVRDERELHPAGPADAGFLDLVPAAAQYQPLREAADQPDGFSRPSYRVRPGGMLEKIRVHEATTERPMIRIPENMPFGELVKTVTHSRASHFPVVYREGRMTGILSINDIRSVLFEETIDRLIVARDIATPNVVRVYWNDTLQQALEKMAAIQVDELPVARDELPDEIVLMISKRDIVNYHYGRSTS